MIIEIGRQMARVKDLLQRYPVITDTPPDIQGQLVRLKRIIERGCVIRSLESAFRVQATDAEYDRWFADQDEVGRDFTKILRLTGSSALDIVKKIKQKAEIYQLGKYLDQIGNQSDTPLAEAIRRHAWEQKELLVIGIINLARRRHKILYIDSSHVAHVGLRKGRLIRLSDPDQGALPPLFTYDSIVFTPRDQKAR